MSTWTPEKHAITSLLYDLLRRASYDGTMSSGTERAVNEFGDKLEELIDSRIKAAFAPPRSPE